MEVVPGPVQSAQHFIAEILVLGGSTSFDPSPDRPLANNRGEALR
jgi:hypothetical protein